MLHPRMGLSHSIAGFIPTENLRFRDDALSFKVSSASAANEGDDAAGAEAKPKAGSAAEMAKRNKGIYEYPRMTKTLISKKKDSKFVLHVEAGKFTDTSLIVLLGQNGVGKTTFIKMLAGIIHPDGVDPENEESVL